MNKKARNLIIGIILILVIVAIFLLYDIFKAKSELGNRETETNTEIVEETNKAINTIQENKVENKENKNLINEENTENTQNTQKEENDKIYTNSLLSKEDRAIELVKNDWGTTEGVYFTKMAIDSNGYYVIFVNKSGSENSSGSLNLAEYRVDVDNNKIVKKKVSHNNY